MTKDHDAKADYYEQKATQASEPRERERFKKLAGDYRTLARLQENPNDKVKLPQR